VRKKSVLLAVLALLVGALALTAAGCGGDDDDGGEAGGTVADGGDGNGGDITPLPSASCSDIEYEGEGDPQVLIASDLPLQGSSRTQTVQMVEGIRFVLNQNGWRAGDVTVAYQ
jgi:hypothetical protein